jgi:hypothetical protein
MVLGGWGVTWAGASCSMRKGKHSQRGGLSWVPCFVQVVQAPPADCCTAHVLPMCVLTGGECDHQYAAVPADGHPDHLLWR